MAYQIVDKVVHFTHFSHMNKYKISTLSFNKRIGDTDGCSPKACNNEMNSMLKERFLWKLNAITRNSAEDYVSPEVATFYNG